MALQQDNPPLNFQELVETYGEEELALQMLQMCEPLLISSLYELFDDLIYEKYKHIWFSGSSFKDRARFIGAYSLANVIRDFRNANRDLDMFILEEKLPALKEKMQEIITECRRLHVYVCELLKMSKEDIDARISKAYEIFDLYLGLSEPKICINYENLIRRYDRLNEFAIWPIIESTCYQIFQERDYFGEIYRALLEQQNKELQQIGNSLAKLAGDMGANILREASQDLEDYAKEEDEEECYRVFIEIIEECLILERYVMVDRLRRRKKAERWIELRPEFGELLEKKKELPSLILEIKAKYQERGDLMEEVQRRNNANYKQNPAMNFQEFVNKCGMEIEAKRMLQIHERNITLQLYQLLDSIIYDYFQGTLLSAEDIQSQAKYLEAHHLRDLCLALMIALGKKDKALIKEKLIELIMESKRFHVCVFKSLKMRKRNIDTEVNKIYEIFDVYLNLRDAKVIGLNRFLKNKEHHMEIENGNDWKTRLEDAFYKLFAEEDFLRRMLTELLEQEYSKFKMSAHLLRHSASSTRQPLLINLCDHIKKEAQNQNDENCFKLLIDVAEECLFIERYDMVKRIERGEQTKKWIKIPEDLLLLIRKKNRLSEAIREIKTKYQIDKEIKRINQVQQEEAKEEECKGEGQLADQEIRNVQHNSHKTFETRVLDRISEEEELGSDHEERKTDVIDLSISPSRKLDDAVIQNKVEELNHIHVLKKNEDEIKAVQRENIVIVSSQKTKNSEDDDYFPFDTGMKCAMF